VQVDEGGSTHDVPYSVQPSLTDLYATVIGFVRRQFLVVLWAVLLTIGLAAFYLFTTPPLYSAEAKLMIDTGKVQVLKQSILSDDPLSFAPDNRTNPRMTRVGQILNLTSIDELPQLINVLRGEMSIVGRPKVRRWPTSIC
jgi:lipopolysaccharide/colanic/teichoic acid biosynthesis glycosyltransferase